MRSRVLRSGLVAFAAALVALGVARAVPVEPPSGLSDVTYSIPSGGGRIRVVLDDEEVTSSFRHQGPQELDSYLNDDRTLPDTTKEMLLRFFRCAQYVAYLTVEAVADAMSRRARAGILAHGSTGRRNQVFLVKDIANVISSLNPDSPAYAPAALPEVPMTPRRTVLHLSNTLADVNSSPMQICMSNVKRNKWVINGAADLKKLTDIVSMTDVLIAMLTDISPSEPVSALAGSLGKLSTEVVGNLNMMLTNPVEDTFSHGQRVLRGLYQLDRSLSSFLQNNANLRGLSLYQIFADFHFRRLFGGISALFLHAAEQQSADSGIFAMSEEHRKGKLAELRTIVADAIGDGPDLETSEPAPPLPLVADAIGDGPDLETFEPAPPLPLVADVADSKTYLKAVHSSLYWSLCARLDSAVPAYVQSPYPVETDWNARLVKLLKVANFFSTNIDWSPEAITVANALSNSVNEAIAVFHPNAGNDRLGYRALENMLPCYWTYRNLAARPKFDSPLFPV